MARPIPEEEPVTMATLLARRRGSDDMVGEGGGFGVFWGLIFDIADQGEDGIVGMK
jgi:hypothetical protein